MKSDDRAENRHISRELAVYAGLPGSVAGAGTLPIAHYFGSVDTDIGTGHVFEAFRLGDRPRLAPTLRQIVRNGRLTPRRLSHLNRFVRDLYAWDIPVTDITSRNIVFGDRDGKRGFFLIDGYGDYRALPISIFLRSARRRQVDRSLAGLAEKMELTWEPTARRFHA